MRARAGLMIALALAWLAPALAETHPPDWVTAIRPSDGKVMGVVQMDDYLMEALKNGEARLAGMPYARATMETRNWWDPNQAEDVTRAYSTYQGRTFTPTALHRTPKGTTLLALFESGDVTDGSARLLAVGPDGRPRLEVPGRFVSQGAGRSILWRPEVAMGGSYLAVQEGDRIAGYHLDAGRRVWAVRGKLARRHGGPTKPLWQLGTELYIPTKDGLLKVEAATGRTRWLCRLVGEDAGQATLQPDGNLYVVHAHFPSVLVQPLQQAAQQRYSSSRANVGSLIPHDNGRTYFSRVFDGEVTSVWERVDGQWRFVFEYGPVPDEERERLYARHGFSRLMQRRLEIEW